MFILSVIIINKSNLFFVFFYEHSCNYLFSQSCGGNTMQKSCRYGTAATLQYSHQPSKQGENVISVILTVGARWDGLNVSISTDF